jgi:hypothetical protein
MFEKKITLEDILTIENDEEVSTVMSDEPTDIRILSASVKGDKSTKGARPLSRPGTTKSSKMLSDAPKGAKGAKIMSDHPGGPKAARMLSDQPGGTKGAKILMDQPGGTKGAKILSSLPGGKGANIV